MKLINKYKVILNRKNDTTSKLNNIKPVGCMAELLEMLIIWKTSKSRWFSKIMVKLLPYTWAKIAIKFPINFKPSLEKVEDLLKSNLKMIVFISKIPSTKPTLTEFFKRVYKIRTMTVFVALAIMVLHQLSFNLIYV